MDWKNRQDLEMQEVCGLYIVLALIREEIENINTNNYAHPIQQAHR